MMGLLPVLVSLFFPEAVSHSGVLVGLDPNQSSGRHLQALAVAGLFKCGVQVYVSWLRDKLRCDPNALQPNWGQHHLSQLEVILLDIRHMVQVLSKDAVS